MIETYSLSKLELLLNETCKTSRLQIATKIWMNRSSSLIKVENIRENGRTKFSVTVLENHKLLATLKYIQKVQAVSTWDQKSENKVP